MITIEEMETMLDDIASAFPPDIYENLNGGISLLPEAKLHPKSKGNELYILGEYHRDGNMGRYIVVYYGSVYRVYGHLSDGQLRNELTKILKHEFRHHLETMAGEKELEDDDDRFIMRYIHNGE